MSTTTKTTHDSICDRKSKLGEVSDAVVSLSLRLSSVQCPICCDVAQEVYVTPCGHSFCYACLKQHLETQEYCPSCGYELAKLEMYPNFMLKEILANVVRSKQQQTKQTNQFLTDVHELLGKYGDKTDAEELDQAVEVIREYKLQKQKVEWESQILLTQFFLQYAREEKTKHIENLQNQLIKVTSDIQFLSQAKMPSDRALQASSPSIASCGIVQQLQVSQQQQQKPSLQQQCQEQIEQKCMQSAFKAPPERSYSSKKESGQNSQNLGSSQNVLGEAVAILGKRDASKAFQLGSGSQTCSNNEFHQQQHKRFGQQSVSLPDMIAVQDEVLPQQFVRKKCRVVEKFNDLMQCYLDLSSKSPTEANLSGASTQLPGHETPGHLQLFQEALSTITRYTRMISVAQYEQRPGVSKRVNNIIAAIDFSASKQHFATTGVCERIDLYDFQEVLINQGESPSSVARSVKAGVKLSGLAWSPEIIQLLLSSGFDGMLHLWDMEKGEIVNKYSAHQKRVWSVDFAKKDPSFFVSGSDDKVIKIWQTNEIQPVAQQSENSSICSVRFNPVNSFLIAAGTAGQDVVLYDIRKNSRPLMRLKGHTRSVSYVSFLNGNELVSSSIDGTIKLWDCKSEGQLQRTFTGHVNNRNFVGLSANESMILCGSETNTVYCYYKHMTTPVLSYKFPIVEGQTQGQSFISAVALKPESNYAIAASGTGSVQILEMQ